MKLSRTPAWNVLGESQKGAWLDIVEVATDGRLAVPIVLRRRVDWAEPSENLALLSRILVDGTVVLEPLEAGASDLEALTQVLQGAEEEERATLTFAAMATRNRIALQPDGRLRLSPLLADHLEAEPGARVWVGALDDRIRLWSRTGWQRLMAESHRRLADALDADRSAA